MFSVHITHKESNLLHYEPWILASYLEKSVINSSTPGCLIIDSSAAPGKILSNQRIDLPLSLSLSLPLPLPLQVARLGIG